MRQIVKGQEPASLIAYRKTPGCNYDDYREKEELRDALVAEQGAICCYCMGRIESAWGSMKIEHWRSQTGHPTEQLKYQNLLGGCTGGEGLPQHLQHCDTRKGNADLHWNPANPMHHIETRVKYTLDGAISSPDPAFDTQLNEVLNLNLPQLKNNRKGAWDSALKWWKDEKNKLHAPPPRERIEQIMIRLSSTPLSPFCQVAIYLLREKIARMA
ncbi:MAG: TIGR02646 family protein [Acidobacteriia bacterium]|nr:TIGR02646 family protein [Terriglobia bacterium]